MRWHSSKPPGFEREGSVSWGSDEEVPGTETGETEGIVNPGGTDTKPAPPGPGAGGLGALAANTLPILKQDRGGQHVNTDGEQIIS